MDCHGERYLMKTINDTTEVSMFVDLNVLNQSVHAEFECSYCHTATENHPDGSSLPRANCAACHEGSQEDYEISIHGKALSEGSQAAAYCSDCHGSHDILYSDNSESKTYHAKLAFTCGECHSRPDVIRLFGRREMDRVQTYLTSVHGKLLHEDPESNAASCNDCHGYHAILPAINSDSPLNVLNIPETCGKCHDEAHENYAKSTHWNSLKRGHYESPVCTDCHGEHEIESPEKKGELGNGALASTRICADCHSSETMMKRFGLDHRRLESYMRSYHGLAVLKNSPEAATCTGCHETHAIRSSLDSLSSVHPTNLQETCSRCHDNVTAGFTQIDMHPVDQQSRNPIAYFFRVMYIWMIVLVIGGMFVHNLIILIYYIREKRKADKSTVRVQRFQPFEVYQHMLLFLSFSVLVITGFSLKFPDAAWVDALVWLGMDEALRSVLHRIAAVVMIVISVIQFSYLVFTKKGRKDLKALMPTRSDLIHFWQNMRFHLGLSREKPEYGKYDYAEKAEYLALIWGTVVMGATGFVLWFPEFFISFLPSWFFETSEVIHYYEAWLATLAILIWHWFFVIYHPEKYPMSTTWMDGKITEEEWKHHHGLEYNEQQEKREESDEDER